MSNEKQTNLNFETPDDIGEITGVKYGTIIKEVIVSTLNLDEECRNDLAEGKGIIIDSVESFDKKGDKIYHGLQSQFFGTDFSDEAAYSERWSCKCGKYIGKQYADGNTICPECKTKIEYNEVDLKKFGWVRLGKYPVISPIFFRKLDKYLGSSDGKKILALILNVNYKSENEGILPIEQQLMDKTGCPFVGKGMIWLSEHLKEVLEFYHAKKKNNEELYEEFMNEIGNIFTHSLPIYSSALRTEMPGEKDKKNFKIKTNTQFRAIINSANRINNYTDDAERDNCEISFNTKVNINKYLFQIQKDLDQVFTEEFAIIEGKRGIIQAKLIAGRHNYTCRCVIIPGNEALRANEIILPYVTFLKAFQLELMNYVVKVFRCTDIEAMYMLEEAEEKFNPDIYSIMRYICEYYKHEYTILYNRNPSINHGSFNSGIVKSVKDSIDDKTLTINTRIISTMGADFDGDQLNLFRMYGPTAKIIGSRLDPIANHYIDGRNGRVNTRMIPMKDEIAIANEIFSTPDKIITPTNNITSAQMVYFDINSIKSPFGNT